MRFTRGFGSPSDTRRTTALRTSEDQVLSGTYLDSDVEAMAREDGENQFQTSKWGNDNRRSRAIDALNSGTEVSLALISYRLHEALPTLESQLEELAALLPAADFTAISAAGDVATAEGRVDDLRRSCRENELPLPEHHLSRTTVEMALYVTLGLGDLIFTTTAFQVFGLSDRPVGFLPFNALQLAASSTVIALLLLTRLVGRFARRACYLADAYTADSRTVQTRRCGERATLRTRIATASLALAVASVLAILLGLSAIRAAYLAELGTSAHAWEFLLIQLGIASAGVCTSFWMAHPLDQAWRSSYRELRTCQKNFQRSQTNYVDLVARFNGLVRRREALVCQFRDWSLATVHDGNRKASVYARRLQHAQPEPTDEALLPPILPRVPFTELRRSLEGDVDNIQPSLRIYEPVSVDNLSNHLAALRRAPLDIEYEHERVIAARFLSPRADRADAAASTNGKRRG